MTLYKTTVHTHTHQAYQLIYQTKYNLVFPLGSWKVKLSVSNRSLLLVSDMFFQQFYELSGKDY